MQRGEARSLSALGHVASDAGEWSDAIDRYAAASTLVREIDDRFGLAGVLGDLATVHLRSGSPEQALPLGIESRAIQREVGNREGEALALATQGYAELGLGNLDRAREALTESTAVAHQLGYLHGLVFSLTGWPLCVRSGDAERP